MLKLNSNLVPGAVWITGISASGKTTAGKNLYEKLKADGFNNVEVLDGEELRKHLDRQYGFTVEERFAVAENIVRVALEKIKSGKLVIVSTITHKLSMRKMARDQIDVFMEVYLQCPVEVCAARDYKGNYRRALSGKLDNFIGVTEQYEVSPHPELVLNTRQLGIEECSALLFEKTIENFQVRITRKKLSVGVY